MLADDPGTAVLTLSAHGMVQRSRPPGMPPSTVVALWKDPTRGLREISLDPGAQGVLMSMAATRSRRRVRRRPDAGRQLGRAWSSPGCTR